MRKERSTKESESEGEESIGMTGMKILQSIRASSAKKAEVAWSFEEGTLRSWGSEAELAPASLCESRKDETHTGTKLE